MSFEKSVGGVIFWQTGGIREYLLLYYPKKKSNQSAFRKNNSEKGYWDFPKGHSEEGETEIKTLRREIKEETGLENILVVKRFRGLVKYFFQYKRETILKKVVLYLVRVKSKDVKISPEHSNFIWVSYQKALELIKFDSTKEILKKAENFLN